MAKSGSKGAQALHNDMKVALLGEIIEDTYQNMIVCVKGDSLTTNDAESCRNVNDLFMKLETAGKMAVGDYDFLLNLLDRAGCRHQTIVKIIKDCSESIKGLEAEKGETHTTNEKKTEHIDHDAAFNTTATGYKAEAAKDVTNHTGPGSQHIYITECKAEAGSTRNIIVNPELKSEIPNSRAMLPYLIKHYRNDYSNIFVSTEGFDACENTLLEHRCLMITGAPGSGKTMIAQQLMVKLWDVKKCHPFKPTKPSEYSKNCNPEIPQCFHIDDVFGSVIFAKGRYFAWISLTGNMIDDLRSENTYIIFTSRVNILKENSSDVNNYEIFSHVINLSDDKFKLTEMNKRDIFENHARSSRLGISYSEIVDPMVRKGSDKTAQDQMGYPQRVRLLCSMKGESSEAIIRYFRHPMEYLSSVIAAYKEKNHLTYCILLLILMNDGILPNSFFHHYNKSSEQVQKCLDMCSLPASTTMGELHATAKALCGSFLILNNGSFATQHESIMEAITLEFGQNYPADIVDSCSIQFLLERVFTKYSAPRDNEYVVILSEWLFSKLCTRLIKEIEGCLRMNWAMRFYRRISGDVVFNQGDPVTLRSISTYRVFGDRDFLRLFLHSLYQSNSIHLLPTSPSLCIIYPTFLFFAILSEKDTLVQKVVSSHLRYLHSLHQSFHLLTSSSPDSSHPTFLFFAAASGQDALVQEVLSSHLCNARRLTGFSAHLDRVLYAACCSGSHVVVRALLAAGARADYRTAHAPREGRYDGWDASTCTTLMHAAYSGSAEVLRLVLDDLLQQQVDVPEHISIGDGWGRTALHWWAKGGRGVAALKILFEAGADMNVRSQTGKTALYMSATKGDEVAVRALLEDGADADARRNDKQTELNEIRNGQPCIRMKTNPEASDELGRTALHCSSRLGNEAIVRLLVTAGADIHLRASTPSWYSEVPDWLQYTDKNALEVAILFKHTAVADFLRSLLSEDE